MSGAVDFHAYFQPQALLQALRERESYPLVRATPQGEAVFSGPGAGRLIRSEQCDIDVRVRMMDEAGVSRQILRVQNVGGLDALDAAQAIVLARQINEEIGAIARHHPAHFIPFAALPTAAPESAAVELRHAVERFGHRGFGISCQINGRGLDDDFFRPVLETAQDLKLPVLLLPNHPPLLEPMLKPYSWLAGAFGFQVDLTWAMLRLLQAGIPEKYPDITFIVANLGGVITSITERLDEYWRRVHTGGEGLSVRPSEALRVFYYETASAHPVAIAAAAQLIGADRLLFGSDYPSFELERGLNNLKTSGLQADDLEKVLHLNADDIFSVK